MDRKLIKKMIQSCFLQYSLKNDQLLYVNEVDFEHMYKKTLEMKKEDPSIDLYEIVHDVVYEFIVN